jgi:hypothetical protein
MVIPLDEMIVEELPLNLSNEKVNVLPTPTELLTEIVC